MFHSVHEVRVELGTKHVIYLKLARFTQKKDIYASRLESVFESVYIPDQNLMQRGDPMELSFESLEIY